MKNFLYCMFIMTLLSIDSNAQPGNSISELFARLMIPEMGQTIMGMRIMIFISLFLYIAQPSLFPISMDRA